MIFKRELSKNEIKMLMLLYKSGITKEWFKKRAKNLIYFKEHLGYEEKNKGGYIHQFLNELINLGILVEAENKEKNYPTYYVNQDKIMDALRDEKILELYEEILNSKGIHLR